MANSAFVTTWARASRSPAVRCGHECPRYRQVLAKLRAQGLSIISAYRHGGANYSVEFSDGKYIQVAVDDRRSITEAKERAARQRLNEVRS